MKDVHFYNTASAKKLGWDPSWFGCEHFDDELTKAIEAWQIKNNISADGLCGPSTFRRIFAEREADIDDYAPPSVVRKTRNHIVYNGNLVPIEWEKVVLWSEPGGMKASPGNYRSQTGKPPRDIKMFVNHWDVCLNAKSCFNVLEKRGISVHFSIDNDGTIYQMVDMQHIAWHAGARSWNDCTVGVEISNAFYPKYNSWYLRNGFGERKMVKDAYVHGQKVEDHLDFYPKQKAAARALWKAVSLACNIPLVCPMQGYGMSTMVSDEAYSTTFRGIIHHHHLSRRKIDCAGFDLAMHLEILKR